MRLERTRPVILVVDDEPANRALARKLLVRHDYEVVEAVDGLSALAAVEAHAPDLVLLDVLMSGLNGFEVCRRIRERPVWDAMQILLLTALHRSDDKVAGLKSGANDFLSKPFEEVELIARVRSLLRSKMLADRLGDMLGRYVSDAVAREILADPAAVHLGGSRRVVTTVFADLRGYSAMVQENPPEKVLAILNAFLVLATDVIQARDGTTNDLLGDGVVGFFGAPVLHDDDPRRAVEAALSLRAGLRNLSRPEFPGVRLQTGIGISTGEAVVGNVGSERRWKYTAIGDTVNVAARLESVAGPGQILIDEPTCNAVKNLVVAQDLGTLKLAGRADWVRAYNVVGLAADIEHDKPEPR